MKSSRTPIANVVTDYLGMACALAILVVIFGLTTDSFFTKATFFLIANQIPDITIMAVGMTFVLIIAGIDLSVGSVLALSGAVMGLLLTRFANFPIPIAILACLGVGLLCGVANGMAVITWRLPSFIVTLGMLEIARGITYWVTQSRALFVSDQLEFFTDTKFGLTAPFPLAIIIVVIAQFVLSRTVFGRYMVAVGTNEEAARLSGINTRVVKVAVFAICGLLSALASVIYTANYQAAPGNGEGMELQVIAAVVVGGTSLMGGRGSVIGTFFGVLIINVLITGLGQADAQESTKRLVTGGVIVAAVVLDYYRQRLRKAKVEKAL